MIEHSNAVHACLIAAASLFAPPVVRCDSRMLHAARNVQDLSAPPGNRLESLKGDRKGQRSIRVNDQWRICFVWKADGAHDVEIVDYHRA